MLALRDKNISKIFTHKIICLIDMISPVEILNPFLPCTLRIILPVSRSSSSSFYLPIKTENISVLKLSKKNLIA